MRVRATTIACAMVMTVMMVTRQRQDGSAMAYGMTGKLAGDAISGTASADMGGQVIEIPWSMKRSK